MCRTKQHVKIQPPLSQGKVSLKYFRNSYFRAANGWRPPAHSASNKLEDFVQKKVRCFAVHAGIVVQVPSVFKSHMHILWHICVSAAI